MTSADDTATHDAQRARIRDAHPKLPGRRPPSTARGLHRAEVLGGLHHLAISVDPQRWRELIERLQASGVEHEVHSGVSVYFRDPDGALIELISDPLGGMYGHQVL